MSTHDNITARILRIQVTADESDDDLTIIANGVHFYRNRASLTASNGYLVPFSGGTGSATMEIELGTVLPPFSIIQIKSTFQA